MNITRRLGVWTAEIEGRSASALTRQGALERLLKQFLPEPRKEDGRKNNGKYQRKNRNPYCNWVRDVGHNGTVWIGTGICDQGGKVFVSGSTHEEATQRLEERIRKAERKRIRKKYPRTAEVDLFKMSRRFIDLAPKLLTRNSVGWRYTKLEFSAIWFTTLYNKEVREEVSGATKLECERNLAARITEVLPAR